MTDLMEGAPVRRGRRHYAAYLNPQTTHLGRSGPTLCTSTQLTPVTVYDQAWHDAETARTGGAACVVGGLPLCVKCERKTGAVR